METVELHTANFIDKTIANHEANVKRKNRKDGDEKNRSFHGGILIGF
jgi:hypothetical protein